MIGHDCDNLSSQVCILNKIIYTTEIIKSKWNSVSKIVIHVKYLGGPIFL